MGIRKSKKSLRSRCANPECDQQFRHARSSKKWCSEACRKVVSRQRQRRAAVEALVRVLAAVQKAKAATEARHARIVRQLAANKAADDAKAAEQQAAEQQARDEQQAAEQERARPRTPTPPAGPITVTFAPAPMFPGTPLPPDQQPPWR